MKRSWRCVGMILIAVMLAVLSGCAPKTDTTDALSDYSTNVNVPFATTSAAYRTLPPAQPQFTIRPDRTETIIGWMNETLDASVKERYTQLALGSLGTNVKNLQKRLIELGYMEGTAGGTFDQATAQAVRLFENAYGQVETGIATQLMQVYLFSDNAKTYSENKYQANQTQSVGSFTTLEKGDMGAKVANLQNRLIELGYLSGSATGIFDTNTENAVKDFEAAYGRQRTGIATASMQSYLFSADAYPVNRITPMPTLFVPSATKTPVYSYTALQFGSKGDEVKNLQTRLKYLGYYTGKVDGIYGNGTVNAIKQFESAYGREETGVATTLLQQYLFSDSAITYEQAMNKPTPTPVLYKTLSKGSYGEDVVKLQTRLIELKYLSGKADGYFGENTENAVKAFEARYGKLQTGVATPDMQRYLFDSGALKNSGQTVTQTEYVALGEGSYGTAVYALEARLTELKYMSGEPDGYYDSSTANAIRAFESANGRAQTGVASVAVQELLYSSKAKANTSASSSDYETLRNGDKNDQVAKLQKRLIELGYLTGTVDGYFGDGTEAAVRAFEAAYGRTQTGVATGLLQSYLFSDNALENPNTEVAVSYATLENGDSGQAVVNLQTRLIQLGYLKGKADGKYGSGTENAVKAFQKALGLRQTGVASASLQKELFMDTAPVYSSASEEKYVTVNKTARVTANSTNVYAKAGASTPIGVLYKGTEITVLRTSGSWAEIKNAAGSVGYANLGDFEYVQTVLEGEVSEVNKTAIITVDQAYVYASPSQSAQLMGKMGAGNVVTWLRTRGEWAEVRNSSGNVGYILKKYLSVSQASSGNAYPSLKTGNTGENVKKIQRRLKELGYFGGEIGGNYLTKTTAAVKAFQKAIGVSQTGNCSSDLQEILFSAAAPRSGAYNAPEARSYKSLALGSSSDAVGELQLKLIALGYLDHDGTIYGTYGATTEKAVINIQNAMGYLNANGIASAELQAFLGTQAAEVLKR